MRRFCFQLRVKPERLDDYRRHHRRVWPDMLEALRDTGWRNYSLFLRDDGLLIGYFEADDPSSTMARMRQTAVDARWQAHMAPLFEEGASGLLQLDEVFHLEDQLEALTEPGA